MGNIPEANGLVKRYLTFTLDSISFSLPEGCVTGFTRANDAKRTTTMRPIPSLARKESGTIKIFGLNADRHKREIKDRLGIIMDGSYLYDGLSMKDMKSIAVLVCPKWSDVGYRVYMEELNLDPRQKASTLSSRVKMKFTLVLAFSHQAELLIMDEPTSGPDPFVQRQFLEIIIDYMKNRGKGASFSTRIASDSDKVTDVLILIDDGKIVFQQSKNELPDTLRIMRGGVALLSNRNKGLIRNLKVLTYGFSTLIDWITNVKKEIPGVLFRKASIGDIMLAYVGRKNDGR